MQYQMIAPAHVNEVWPLIEQWVDTARGVDRTYSVEDIKALCVAGGYHLWIIKDASEYFGFLIACIIPAPRGRVYYGAWLGGKDLARWTKDGLTAIENYARSIGCVAYSFIGRKAWQKLLGYEYEGIFYFKNL